jgi:4-amino-4-deoxy-L-arabinose transferase-like glycosyltransferase
MSKPVRKDLYWAIGIFIFAFAVRLIYLDQVRNSALFDTPIMDAEYHDQWAQAILAGDDFTGGVFFRAPLYPYFLAAVYKIFGHNYLMARLIQFLIGSLSCVLIYLLGKSIFNRRTGTIAGVVASLYGVLIYFEGELLIPVLLVFLDLLVILCLFWAKGKPSYGRWVLCGALLGLSALARPNILLVGAAFFIWLILRSRNEPGKRYAKGVLYAGCFAVGAILVISPVTLRNYVKGNDLVLIASQGGMNFYIGNNPQSDGASAIFPGARSTWWGSYQDAKSMAEQSMGISLKPSEISRFWYIEGLRFAVSEPLFFFRLMAKKLILFWNGNELSNNRDFYFFARSAPILKPLVWHFIIYFPLGLIAPLAIIGIILSHREKKDVAILEIFLLVYMVSIVVFFVTARYRVPLIPVFVLFGAYALDRFAYQIKKRRVPEFARYLVALLAIAIPINLPVPGYSSANPAQAHYTLGVIYADQGEIEKAEEQYKKALTYNPGLSEAYVNLGSIYGDRGDHQMALDYYRTALKQGADSAFVLYNIGIEYHNQGLWDQAEESYRRSLSLRDDNPKGHYLLGEILLRKNMLDRAIGQYERAVSYDPQYATAFYRLGTIYLQMGRKKEAIASLESFVRLWRGDQAQLEQVVGLLKELKEESPR